MRDKIEKILSLQGCDGYDAVGEILSLLAPTIEKAEKWDKLKALFDTSCDKCFLNHICGTHGNPGAVCEDIKEAVEGGQGDKS